jgi:hypothetical protein
MDITLVGGGGGDPKNTMYLCKEWNMKKKNHASI